jgi:predicted Rossmann fold flavoprotein
MNNSIPDVIVVGGGPAGLFAAIAAGQLGARVILLEKGDRLGKKLLISGGGRCNVTNSQGTAHLIENTPGNGRFLHSVYAKWSNQEIINFFTTRGVQLVEEDHGRLFPATHKAITILQTLIDEMNHLGVEVRLNNPVRQILFEQGKFMGLNTDQGILHAKAVVIATGGITAQATGSTGDGYRFAKSVGHRIVAPYPTSVPIISSDLHITAHLLQGIAVRGVDVKLIARHKKVLADEEGDLLFTHFGISGPVALRLSQYLVKERLQHPEDRCFIQIDFVPAKPINELKNDIQEAASHQPKKLVKQIVKAYVPERLAEVLTKEVGLEDQRALDCVPTDWELLALQIKRWRIEVDGTLGIDRAFVTGGGVDLKGIEPHTLASKYVRGMYFAGELLDLHAHTGGYNITAAFSTGYVAGSSAASYVDESEE